jgi:hypothetical protein
MAKLTAPFWVAIPREPASHAREQPFAFSTTDEVSRFFRARIVGLWKLRLIGGRSDVVLLISDLHRDAVTGLCLDPEPDGTGGTHIPLADVLWQAAEDEP